MSGFNYNATLDEINTYLNEIKSRVRDVKLELIDDSENVYDLDISKRYNKRFRWRYPNRHLIKYVIKSGGILSGSRALRCWTLNGNQLFNRKTKDWDFLVSRDQALKICSHFNIPYNLVDTVISIKKCRYWAHPHYSDSYPVGPVDVQLIISDNLPDFTEKKRIRFTSISQILSEKIKIVDSIFTELNNNFSTINSREKETLKKELFKHLSDLSHIIINIHSHKK